MVQLVTPFDSVVSVPNSEIINNSVFNSNTDRFHCQVVGEVFLPIGVDTQRVRQIAQKVASVSRYVYLNKHIEVVMENEVHASVSMLKVRLKEFVLDLRYEFAFKSEITESLIQELIGQKVISPKS